MKDHSVRSNATIKPREKGQTQEDCEDNPQRNGGPGVVEAGGAERSHPSQQPGDPPMSISVVFTPNKVGQVRGDSRQDPQGT